MRAADQRPLAFYAEESDENGEYTIKGVDPGAYHLGINIVSTPNKQYPYAGLYYPNAPDRIGAQKLNIPEQPSVTHADLQPVKRLRLISIQGTILGIDNKPPTEYASVRIKGRHLDGQVETDPLVVDSAGNFENQLCEGETYSIFGFSGPPASTTYSLPFKFVASEHQERLLLILNANTDEFRSAAQEIEADQ